MEEKKCPLTNTCNFSGGRPIMADLPYPPLQVKERNRAYADLLSVDYCGSVSEMSAITQYINNENRLSIEMCGTAKTLLGIAMAEMIHLQKLGELICLLGGQVDFTAKKRKAEDVDAGISEYSGQCPEDADGRYRSGEGGDQPVRSAYEGDRGLSCQCGTGKDHSG